MNIRSLEVFLALSEELHFRRVADRLGMSQSLVSEHVRKLELYLGCDLFERTSRRVVLTEHGEELRRRIYVPVTEIKKSLRDIRFSTSKKIVRLGFMGGGFYEMHETFVERVSKKYPEITLDFVELHYDNQFSSVINGSVDMCLCRLPIGLPGLQSSKVLMRDDRVVCVNKNHRLASARYIDFEELAGETMLQAPIEASGKAWVDFHFPLSTPGGKNLVAGKIIKTVREGLSAVASGSGIFLMTKRASLYYNAPNVKYIDVNLTKIESALVWNYAKNDEKIEKINDVISELFE